MKADKKLIDVNESDSTAVVKNKRPNSTIIFLSLLPFLSFLTILLTGFVNNSDVLDLMKTGILAFLLTTAMVFFVRMHDNIFDVKFSKSIIVISYLVSILLIMLEKNPEIYNFWMIGALLITMLIDNKLGLMVYFNLAFILSIRSYLNPESTIHFLIMGVLFALLSKALRNKSTIIYSAIIILSTNITLAFILNNFIFETKRNSNYLASFFSILAVLVTAFLLSLIYDWIVKKYCFTNEYAVSVSITEQGNNHDNTISNDELNENNRISSSDRSIRSSYDILLSEDNELLLKMKEHSEALYKHSILIGELSGRAASIIGANEDLARAGGYYHEVGKVISKNYIIEGLKLADEYAFPEELKSILRQHSIKHDKPTFVEAAIVMMSDNVASTIEYIEKTGEGKFTSDKIIDNIFRMRMEKGTFDESGLSVRDFKLLKEFYQNEYRNDIVES